MPIRGTKRGDSALQHEPAISVDPLAPVASGKESTAKQSSQLPLTLQDRFRRLGTRSVIGIAILLLLTAWTLLWMRMSYDNRIYPTVYVADMRLGGLSYSDAKGVLNNRAASLDNQAVTFTYGDRTWSPKLSELGVTFDANDSVENAYEVGREDNAWERLKTTAGFLQHDRRLPLQIVVDGNKLDAWFDQVDDQLGQPPHDAYLKIDGDQVTVVREADGTIINRQAAQQVITDALRQLQPQTAPLPVISITAKVHESDLTVAQHQVQQALSETIVVKYDGDKWTLKPEDLGQFVVQTVDPNKSGADAVSVSLDEKGLARWLSDQLKGDINRDSKDAVVGWNKHLVAVEPSVDGIKLRQSTLAKRVSESFFSNHADVEVPVSVIKPRVDSNNLAALGIVKRISGGDSNFEGSDEGRSTNIEVGASLLNGTLIAPGEEFSFNHAIGVISEDAGFVESQVVDGERIGRDIGGGICQVSTTVYRAAWLGGLEITEWHPHLYRLKFYELDDWKPGIDASILQPEGNPFAPGGDFKFVNTTDSWMLIESYVQGTQVVVIIYGGDLGYTVNISDPQIGDPVPPTKDLEIVDPKLDPGTVEQSETEQEGVTVAYHRDVYDREGNEIRSDDWVTAFASRGNVWKVSPDMKGQSPVGQE
jgi:vancomycin resistance protein YoaR